MRWLLAFLIAPGLAHAGPVLYFPLGCTLGQDCYVQQYVDTDPNQGVRDFTCSGLSYNGHKGTDFAVPSSVDVARGVPVYAAADGVVQGVRDGVADTGPGPDTSGQECGNGAVIRHGDGWETQYCHLRRGSLAVASGQRVTAGTFLGYVGQSGRAEFPHLHLSVRHNGTVIDPFDTISDTCGDHPEGSLWAEPITYEPGGIVSIGFAPRVPEYADIKAGKAGHGQLSAGAPAIVLWGYGFGSRPGDTMELTIITPDGRQLHQRRTRLEKQQALYFRAGGKKRPDAGWPAGKYLGVVKLIRAGEIVDQHEIELVIR